MSGACVLLSERQKENYCMYRAEIKNDRNMHTTTINEQYEQATKNKNENDNARS